MWPYFKNVLHVIIFLFKHKDIINYWLMVYVPFANIIKSDLFQYYIIKMMD